MSWFINDVIIYFLAHLLKNIAILSPKGATFRCLLMGVSKNEF